MKAARLVLACGVCYATALTAVWLWPAPGWNRASGSLAASLQAESPGSREKFSEPTATGRDAGASGGISALPGVSGPAPTMDQVFNATGLDRMLLMARFIQTATPAELEAAIDRDEKDNGRTQSFADQLWLRWAELDPAAALRHKPQGAVWWALAKLDTPAALEAAGKAGPQALASVFHSIAQDDPARARQLLAEHPEVSPRMVNSGIVDGLEHQDPGAAMAFALESGAFNMESKFKLWLSRDPDGVQAWMKGLTDPLQRRRLEDMTLDLRIAEDPAAGLEAARQLPPGIRQVNRTLLAISSLAATDPEAARAAAEAMPTALGRQKALAFIAQALSSSDPAAATAMVSTLDWKMLSTAQQSEWRYNPGPGQSTSSGSGGVFEADDLISQLISVSPKATADALAALPADSGAPLGKAIQKWVALQPEAASSWLKDQPAGPARDEGIGVLASWLVWGNPEPDYAAAMAWAGAASPEIQESLFANTLTAWKNHDPAAAAAAVASLPVSEEQRDRMRSLLK